MKRTNTLMKCQRKKINQTQIKKLTKSKSFFEVFSVFFSSLTHFCEEKFPKIPHTFFDIALFCEKKIFQNFVKYYFCSNKRKREDNENLKPSLAKKIRSSSGETEEQMNNLSLSNN